MKMKIQQATLKIQSIDRLRKKNGMTMKIDAREYLTKSNTHPWFKKKNKKNSQKAKNRGELPWLDKEHLQEKFKKK